MVKILDFGLNKATSDDGVDYSLTHQGQMLGTPDYIAPEQVLNAQSVDIRADIYSLGCTLYYLLSGGPPFRGDSLFEVLQAHHSMEAKPLTQLRPELPSELVGVVAKMMAKEPGRRFQTPAEVAHALTPFFKKGTVASLSATRREKGDRGFECPADFGGPTPQGNDANGTRRGERAWGIALQSGPNMGCRRRGRRGRAVGGDVGRPGTRAVEERHLDPTDSGPSPKAALAAGVSETHFGRWRPTPPTSMS